MNEQLKVSSVPNKITTVLFVIYLIAICWILLFKLGVQFSYMERRSVNLIPFNEPLFLSSENILNAIIFIPLGIYSGILFKRWSVGSQFLFFFLLSLIIEGSQYIFRVGAFDVTDIITNTVGGVVGWIIFNVINKAFSNSLKAQKFINLIAATGTVLMILLLVLLKMNMLPIRYQ
jgi:glycopeptide antibiotics resistance protein